MEARRTTTLPAVQGSALFLLRVVIGWHFLYEGLAKIWDPGWSAAGYLDMSRWLAADFFHWIASNPTLLFVANTSVKFGLVLIGLSLILGSLVRLASVGGIVLLLMFYVCNPPLVGLSLSMPLEGSYLIVNKNMVEMAGLLVLAIFPCRYHWGIDRFVHLRMGERFGRWISRKADLAAEARGETEMQPSRRDYLMAMAGLPVLAGFILAAFKQKQWQSYEEKNLVAAVTSATSKALDIGSLTELKGQLPQAAIKGIPLSRVILGGNLMSGWAHSRDLIYVSQLVKAYHTKARIFATLLLAEKCGINTILTNPILCSLIDEYWKRNIGKIQFISDCAGLVYNKGKHVMPFDEYMEKVKRAIDYGACACYVQGETADFYIENGHIDRLEQVMRLIKDNGLPVGIGAHRIETIQACVKAGFAPDFWMKTLHHHNYWSARHPEWKDNIYCFRPEETIAFMESLPQPWIAFKILAAGAIHPADGFRYAFENGADFACVGMYDFQLVQNVNTALDVLNLNLNRKRPWRSETLLA
jgi:uncharacterized membrane protein YphA (DoxX/SURF4 family)